MERYAYIDEEMWENLPPSFKLYCKQICNENNYKMDSEPTTTTTNQGRSAKQAETVPTATTEKGKEIAINSLRRLNVTNEGVEETTMNTTTKGALMDSGANGGMAGSDMRILNYHAQDHAHGIGIAGNSLLDLPIVTGAALIMTTHGPLISMFHQYAHYGKGNTTHSVPQLESYDIKVMCTSRKKCGCLLYTSPSPRDGLLSRMPSSA